MKTHYGKLIDLKFNQFIDSWHILIQIDPITFLEGTLPPFYFEHEKVPSLIGKPIEIAEMHFDWYEYHLKLDDDSVDAFDFERVRDHEEWCHELADDLWDDFELC